MNAASINAAIVTWLPWLVSAVTMWQAWLAGSNHRQAWAVGLAKNSKLWQAAGLPLPGQVDAWGGWTLPISQHWWGHRAEKLTWLYIVGCAPRDIPAIPLRLGDASHVIAQSRMRRTDGTRLRKGMAGWRPEVSKAEREHTPPALAEWLVELARRCSCETDVQVRGKRWPR